MNSMLAALVNGIMVSALLAGVVGVALRLTPRSRLNAATRHAIWWAVLIVTVALPAYYFQPARVFTPKQTFAEPVASGHRSFPSRFGAVRVGSERVEREAGPIRLPLFPIAMSPGPWSGRIVTLWLVCALVMLARLIVSALILERRKMRALPLPVARWMEIPERSMRVATTSEIAIPVVCGPWRATILLPSRLLDQLSEMELEQIGIHEAAHLVRYDDYKLLIQRIVQALFVLHPVVHWVSRHIDLEREIACDDFVVAATGDPRPYAACLARVVELSGGVRAASVVAAAAVESRSHLARRVEMLFDARRHAGTRLLGVRLAVAMCGIAAMAWGAVRMPTLVLFRTPTLAPAPVRTFGRMAEAPQPAFIAQAIRPAVPISTPEPAPPAPMVLVPVEVRDPLGRFVTGLDASVFSLKEDGVEQAITQLWSTEDRADMFVLVGWEVKPETELQPLLQEHIDIGSAADVVQVHGLGQLPATTSPLDEARIIERRLGHLSQRQAAVVIADGKAGWQRYTDQDIEKAIGTVTMPVFVFDVSGADSPSDFLRRLATGTGGRYYAAKHQRDIPELLMHEVISLRNMYVLGYTPKDAEHDSGHLHIAVSITPQRGLPPLTVSYRALTAN